jgi:predicted small integral membrane protein
VTLRVAKIALVFAVTLYTTLIVFNNLTDYDSNFQFVRHVLMMDSTFDGNHGMWRALNSRGWHVFFYWTIILGELVSALFCGWGGIRLTRLCRSDARQFQRAKNVAIVGLTLNLLLWAVAFLAIGGEWFLMWQSKMWNGEGSAFRMFTIVGIVLVLLTQPEGDNA